MIKSVSRLAQHARGASVMTEDWPGEHRYPGRTSGSGGRGRSHRDQTGFTLIEVLVVVAIVALLISILLPSLRTARDQAKIVTCNANMHEFGTAIFLYAHDFPPHFPLTPYVGSTIHGGAPGTDDNLFILWYRNYVKDIKLYSCPATSYTVRRPDKVEKKPATNGIKFEITTAGVKDRNDFERVAQSDPQGFGTSYEYNDWYDWVIERDSTGKATKYQMTWIDWYYGRRPWEYDMCPKNLAMRLPNPAYSMLMHDADDGGRVTRAPAGQATNNYPEPWDNHGSRGLNMLFADGHSVFVLRRDADRIGWDRSARN